MMKKIVKTILFLAFIAVLVSACTKAGKTSGGQIPAAEAGKSAVNFSDANFSAVEGRDWNLAEIRRGQERVAIDRAAWAEEGFEKYFTLRFEDDRIGGAGAPNRYFAPYSLDANNTISIGMIAGTLMAPFIEPKELNEYDFFALLQKAAKWNLAGEYLELYSAEDGTETVLIFALAGDSQE